MADAASACDTGNTNEDRAANNPTSSTTKDPVPNYPVPTKDPAPNDLVPTKSTTTICEIDSVTEQDALPMASTQPENNSVSLPSNSTTAIVNSPTIATNDSAPYTSTAATNDAASSPHMSKDVVGQMSTTNDHPEMNLSNTSSPQGSPDDKAQTTARTAGNSQPVAKLVTGKTDRRSERRARKTGVESIITKTNHLRIFSAFGQFEKD
jgi:hypothetical protein